MNKKKKTTHHILPPPHVIQFLHDSKVRQLRNLGLTEDLTYTEEARNLIKFKAVLRPTMNNKEFLRVFYINARSISNKINNINNHAIEEEADVLVITETWHNQYFNPDFPSYSRVVDQIRENTTLGRGGGTAIYVKNTLKNHFTHIDKRKTITPSTQDIQLCAINGLGITIWSIYRSPNTRNSHDMGFLKKLQNKLNFTSTDLILGDFNLSTADWDSSTATSEIHQEYITTFMSQNFEQIIREPTHAKGGTPDLVYVGLDAQANVTAKVKPELEVNPEDHFVIIVDYRINKEFQEYEEFIFQTVPDRDQSDYEAYEKEILDISDELNSLNQPGPDQDTPAIAITKLIQKTVDKHIKTKLIRIDLLGDSNKKIKWIKNRMSRVRKSEKTRANGKLYQNLSRQLKLESEKQKEYLDKKRIQALSKTDRDAWGVMKSVCKPKADIVGQERFLKPDGSTTSTREEAVDVLAKHFGSVTTNEEDFPDMTNLAPSWEEQVKNDPFVELESPLTLEDALLTERLLVDGIDKLNSLSAPGFCSLFSSSIKKAGPGIYTPLLNLFNNCISAGKFPRIWKIAWIKCLPKKGGNALDPANMRPISILPTLGKLFVICLGLRANAFHETWYRGTKYNQILPNCQFGFRKRSSCEDNLATALHNINHAVDSGLSVDVILYDFKRAFDTTTFGGKLRNIIDAGLAGLAPVWMDYFKDRLSFVRIRETDSLLVPTRGGCPQGCPSSPHNFAMYLRELYPTNDNNLRMERAAYDVENYDAQKAAWLNNDHKIGLHMMENWENLEKLEAKYRIYENDTITLREGRHGVLRESQKSKQDRASHHFQKLFYADDLKTICITAAPDNPIKTRGHKTYWVPEITYGDQQTFIWQCEEFNRKKQLAFHPSKCQSIHFGKHNLKKTYYMTNPNDTRKQTPLEKVELVRDLGLWYRVDKEGYLCTKPTFERMLVKARALIFACKKLLKGATLEKYNIVFHAIIKSQFTFCSSLWFRDEKSQNDALNRIYKDFFSNVPIKNRKENTPICLPETISSFLRKLHLKRCYRILNGETILEASDFWDVTNNDRTHLNTNRMETAVKCWCNYIIKDYLKINPRGDTRVTWEKLDDHMDKHIFDKVEGLTLRLEIAGGAYENAYKNWRHKLKLIREREDLLREEKIGFAILENMMKTMSLTKDIEKSESNKITRRISKLTDKERFDENMKIRTKTKNREEFKRMVDEARGLYEINDVDLIYEA